jgi:hypothetical protein
VGVSTHELSTFRISHTRGQFWAYFATQTVTADYYAPYIYGECLYFYASSVHHFKSCSQDGNKVHYEAVDNGGVYGGGG